MIALNENGGQEKPTPVEKATDKMEKDLIRLALAKAPLLEMTGAPNLTHAAKSIGLSRPTFLAKARRHRLWPWKGKK